MADYSFLVSAGAQPESNLRAPLRIPLPKDADPQQVANGLSQLHPDCRCVVVDGGLQVILPPNVKTGLKPFDLRELAFVLRNANDVDELGIPGEWEHCCGNGGGGCCANKG
jgi:hypothetical protein